MERWIIAGRPLQVRLECRESKHRLDTPLSMAIQSGQYDLAVLLLANGYRLSHEPRSALNLALKRRSEPWIDLLVAWGADPAAVDLDAVLDTYSLPLMEKFWELGLDFTSHRRLAWYLTEATRNKPAYGFAKRHLEHQRIALLLDMALGEAVVEGDEKAISLLLWAGANPHRRVPSLRWDRRDDNPDDEWQSAVELAVQYGNTRLLAKLKPHPELDDFNELFASVRDQWTLEYLADIHTPADWSQAVVGCIVRVGNGLSDPSSAFSCLKVIFQIHGGRLNTVDSDEYRSIRKGLLSWQSDTDLRSLLRRLASAERCDPHIYEQLTRTRPMKAELRRLQVANRRNKTSPNGGKR